MKKNLKIFTLTSSLALAAGLANAQTTTTWNGSAGDGLWNTAGNWDAGVPAEGYDAVIPASTPAVSYNSPMTATSFGSLLSSNSFTVASTGFNATGGITFSGSGGQFRINSGGVVSGASSISMQLSSWISVASGATVDAPLATLSLGANGSGNIAFLTNSGGTIKVAGLRVNPNNQSSSARAIIQGGDNSLGAVLVKRSSAGSGGYSSLGSEGLLIYGGTVNMTSLDVGGSDGNSWLTYLVAGGSVTNSGDTILRHPGGRGSRMLQTGGVQDLQGVLNIRGNPSSSMTVIYSVTGGTNLVKGIAIGNPDGLDMAGNIRITNAAKMYVGSSGMTSIGTQSSKIISLNAGSVLGAQADWTGTEPLLLGGGAIECADLSGVAHNITISGPISGSATAPLIKTGAGTLTLDGTETYAGETIIQQGTLAIGSLGTLTSANIRIPAGTTLDLSQANSFSLTGGRTISGFGTIAGTLNVGTSGIVNPGTNDLGGLLTVSGAVSLNGGGIAHFDLTSSPSSTSNDKLRINGDLTLIGNNTVEVLGSPAGGSTYTVIEYTGTFNGDISSLTLAGASGTLNHDAANKRITLTVAQASREPTAIAWVGNDFENVWDAMTHTNWINLTTSKLDTFIPGDDVLFNALGASHSTVDLVGTVLPNSVRVDSTADYTLQGLGSVGGPGTLIKTNSGTLTITAANTYTGPTIIQRGKISVAEITAPSTASPLGAAGAAAANLVLNGGTLRYTGPSFSMARGMQIDTNGGAFEIADAAASVQTFTAFEGPGKLTKSGPGTLDVRIPNSYTGGTEILAGTVRIDKATDGNLGTGTITLNGNPADAVTLRFSADGQTVANPVQFLRTNNFVQNGGNDTFSGPISGDGTVALLGSSGNVLTFAGDMTAFSGTIILDTTGNLRFLPSQGSAAARFDLGASGLANNRNGNITISLGTLVGGPGSRLQGGSSNDGDGRTSIYRVGGRNEDAIFDGVISEASPLRKLDLVKEGTGTWTLSAVHTYTGNTTVSNGVLALSGGSSFDNSTNVTIVAPGRIDVTTKSDLSLNIGTTLASQTLSGNGFILGSLSVGNAGTVIPGLPTGTLTVSQSASVIGVTVIRLDRSAAINSGRIVASSVSLGGELVVTNVGAALAVGDTFDLFDGAITGGFGNIVLPAGYTWNTDNLLVDGTIRVAAVLAPPQIGGITISGGNAVLTATGGTPGAGVNVLSSADLTLPIPQWTVSGSGNFDANGNLQLSVPIDTANAQRFYTLQLN